MSKRRNCAELVYLTAHAGFGPGRTYGWILPNPEWYWLRDDSPQAKTRLITDLNPCPLECGDPACREWNDVLILDGADRAAAVSFLIQGSYQACAYHLRMRNAGRPIADRPNNKNTPGSNRQQGLLIVGNPSENLPAVNLS